MLAQSAMRKWDSGSNLVLIGMPGCGKSTLGRHFAKAFNMPFTDTDDLLQKRVNCTVQQLVDRRGLNNFRQAEQATVCDMNVKANVISTGGSVVYSEPAMQHLSDSGLIVFLRISLPTVRARLAASTDRGLVKYPSDSIAGLFYERSALYARWADVTLDNNWPLTALRIEQLIRQLGFSTRGEAGQNFE